MSVVKPPEIHKSTKISCSCILNKALQLNAISEKQCTFFSICRAQVKNGFLNEAINVSYGKQYTRDKARITSNACNCVPHSAVILRKLFVVFK